MHRTFISFCVAAFVVGASGLGSFKQDSSSPPFHRAEFHLKRWDHSQLKSYDVSPSLNSKRLALRGGGLPVLLLGAAALTATASNEGVRSRFLKALSNVRIGPYQLKQKPRLKKVVDVAPPKQAAIGTKAATLDVRNGTWACEVLDEVEVLDQSVVLLVRHGRTGSSGFIINRPTQFDVGDVTKKLPQFESNPLYLGGDIGEGVYMIHGVPGLENATEVSDGIFYGGSDEVEDFVRSGRAAPQDFRFFFKYTAWLPGQLENEINAGCWCPVRTSLDLVLQRRNYAGLHYSKHHKVYWHQILQLLGGRYVNISHDTIAREEMERIKAEEWIGVLQDGGNQSLKQHQGVELGALAMASSTSDMEPEHIAAVHARIRELSAKALALATSEGADSQGSARTALGALSRVFFEEFRATEPVPPHSPYSASHRRERDRLMGIGRTGRQDPEAGFVHTVVAEAAGTPRALAPLYMAAARQLGFPLEICNCSLSFKAPVQFLVRVVGEGEGPRVYVDLADKGALLSEEEALAKASKLNPALATEAGLRGLSHVQLYLCVMHEMVDFYSRVGDEGQLMAWLQQIRILQTAVSTLAVAEYEARTIDPANAADASTGAEDGRSGGVQLLPPAQLFKSGKLRTAGGGEFLAADLEGKYVGLYFSASWCGPCKKFTPELIKTYCKMKMADGRPLEVVFVSSDRSAEAFERYADTMPWPAVPFADEESRVQLAQQLGVSSIPMFVLVAPDGSVTTTEGHRHILTDPLGEHFPWAGDSSTKP